MPHAEYDVYAPRSNATTSRVSSRRSALVAALIPAASPPTIASRSPIARSFDDSVPSRRSEPHEQRHLPDLSLARRLRRRAQPEPRHPARRGRGAPARVGDRHRRLARRARPRRRRAQPGLRGRRGGRRQRRRLRHGSQDVRAQRRVGRVVARLVGRGLAVPHAGVRAHPPRARAAGDAGRDHVPLRHRRHRVRARAGARGGRRPRRDGRRRRDRRAAVPRRRAARRAVPAHRAGAARRRRAAARERRRPAPRARRGRRLAGRHARQVPRSRLRNVPELPEVEITARRLDAALRGAEIESTLAPGINALKTFDPPLHALDGKSIAGVRRIGKHLVIDVAGDLHVLVHLMSAGRLQLYDKRASLRDRTSRLLIRVPDGRELRLREFGTKQAAWVKVLRDGDLDADDAIATLGPEAWPEPPENLRELLDQPRPLHSLLRDQRVIAGIGRSWVDEILWEAKLSPFKRGDDLDDDEAAALRRAIRDVLNGALEHYERFVQLPLAAKLPLPLQVHRHQGEPCPRCGATIEAVFYEDYVMCYCPEEQTGGKVLKDRRLSRLLK